MTDSYETIIGLEVHIELATKTKLFCGCSTSFGDEPNVNTCPVCTGMPGSLPVLNRQVVEHAIAVGLATNCSITQMCKFDRKNYFYPDNPQNYQISQLYLPICSNGNIEIELSDQKKEIRIREIHMEEDAGKLIHDDEKNCTLVDFNRSGVPLLEIVSEPDMRSAEEVIGYLKTLQMIVQDLGASDGKLQEGSMRVDVNLSVRKNGQRELGTRTETKNMNSFKAIVKAIENERVRQINLLERGAKVVQETRRWNDVEGKSSSLRSKENVQDYRYFPDPDLPPVKISDTWIENIRKKRPEFRLDKIKRYRNQYGLSANESRIIAETKELARLFEAAVKIYDNPQKLSHWLVTETIFLLKAKGYPPSEIRYSAENLAKLVKLVSENYINNTVAKQVFEVMFDSNIDPEKYVTDNDLMLSDSTDEIETVVIRVIDSHPHAVEQYKRGESKVLSFLIGCAMRELKGKGNPNQIKNLIKKRCKI